MTQVERLFARYGPRYRLWVTLTVMLGLVALGMSITIVNVAIPYMKEAFGMSNAEAQWLSTGFLASTTISLLISPWLVASFGQRATFIGLLVAFIVASILGGLGQSMAAVVAARIVQGGMTGLIRPLAMQALFAAYPPEGRGMATAMYGICLGLPLTLATVIGGWLVEHLSWHYVFFATLPFCFAAIAMGLFFLPGREHSGPRQPFDWAGIVLLSFAVFALLVVLSNGQQWGWLDPRLLGLGLLSLGCSVAFVAWQKHTPHPLLDLDIFRYRLFVAGTLAMCLFGGTFYGIMYLLPQFVQSVLHYGPIRAGEIFLPSTLVLAILVPLIGWMSDRYPPHRMTLPGLFATLLAVWLMSQMNGNTTFIYLTAAMTVLSFGMAAFPPPTLSTAIAGLPIRLIGHGSGAINFALQLGGALGTAGLVVLLDRRTASHAQRIEANPDIVGTVGVQPSSALEPFDLASVMAYQEGFWTLVASLLLVAIPSLLLSYWRRLPRD